MKKLIVVCMGLAACAALAVETRPLVIGLSDSFEPSFEGLVHEWPTMSGTALSYVDAIGKAGHVPIVLCRTTDTNTLERIMGTIDLLIMTGGVDVDPKLYHEENRKCGEIIPERDRFDWALMDIAVRRRIPVLGICRGTQFINVYFGGSLCQDIRSEWEPKTTLSHGMGPRAYAHTIDIEPDSRLARVLGETKGVRVNSQHHQCVKRPGKGLRIVARSPDGVVEGIEHETLPIAGLQFHPEASISLLNDPLLFRIYRDPLALVSVASADALDDLVPRPRRVTRTASAAAPAALAKVKVVTGDIAGVPQHLAGESYRLEIAAGGVTITAPDARGVRYAKTTLAQLGKLAGGGSVPCCTIEDWPAYRWRGFMPDTARNFMPLPLLKDVVDYMAAYKLNLLHWHLTENYAWRLESKRYPQLQSKEAFLIRYVGDYYTQEDFREMVRYCAERGVTIMPELDVPGHAQAFRRAFGFSRMTAHGADRIVADLFDELCTLATPEEMPFVHVGGDEVWKREMEGVSQETLGLWAETLAKNGRTLVRWDGAVKKDGKMSAPNEQFPVKGPWVGMQWCGHEGEIPVNPIFDANGMYIETKDPFDLISIALFHRLCPWTNLTDEMKLGGIFCGWHDGFVGPDHEKVFRNEPIVPSCVLFGEAFWCGEAADLPGNVTRLPPRGTPEFAAVVDLENRVIAQRDRVLRGLRHPFHFLRQSDLAWRVTDAETGRVIAADQPGATVRPLVRPDHPANLFTNQMGKVVMETWIRSPKTQKVGAWIGFTGMDRDHGLMRQAPLPKLGEWNRFGAKAELNGEELAPPKWQYAGMEKGKPIPEWTCWDLYEIDEKPYADHEYFMREPTPITLREGWNHVKLTLPMTTPVKAWWSLPWIGTFIPVAGTTDHPQEVPGLEYSAEPRN